MKALVIAPQPFFTPRGTPFSVYYRALVTSELGTQIDLLCYGEGEDVDIPGVRMVRVPNVPWFGRVKIGPSWLKLLIDGLVVLWTIGLLIRNRYDFVHAHEEAVFFCVFLKPIFQFKLIYDMHSSLPQQLTNFKFTKSRFLIDLFKKLEDRSINRADAIITICPDLADYVLGVIKDPKRHFLIENSIFDPVKIKLVPSASQAHEQRERERQLKACLPPGKRLIVYTGTLEPYQGIHLMIRALPQVIDNIPEAFLLIAGGAPEQVEQYREMAKTLGLADHCLLTGQVSQPLAQYFSSVADVLVSPRSEGTNTPLKIYQQLASGIPLVATRIYSHTQVLDATVAHLVNPEPEDMANGIIEALNTPPGPFSKTAKAVQLYQKKYSRQSYDAKMRQLLELVA